MRGTWPGSTPNSPGAVTSSTSRSRIAPRGVVRESFICLSTSDLAFRLSPSGLRRLLLELLGPRAHVVDDALHVERLFGEVVALAVDDLLEARDGVLDLDVLAGRAGERLGDEERLREEALDLARARHGDLVVLGELVHAEDGDDVLQVAVLLERG